MATTDGNKFVIDDQDVYMVKCPSLLLQKMDLKDHVSYLIEETLNSHHEQYGCSSTSLLSMWYFWHYEFQAALEEGCEVRDIIEYSQTILENVISLLPKIIIQCENTFLQEPHSAKDTCHHQNQACSALGRNNNLFRTFNKKSGIPRMTPNNVPMGIRYSSRHFSPFPAQYAESEEESENEFLKNVNKSGTTEQICLNEKVKQSMYSLVEKLCHGDTDFINVILEVWTKQAQLENTMKFNIDGIIICPVTLPCSYSTLVDGLIIKSNLNFLYDQDLENVETNRALIVKGSITFDYVHLGAAPKESGTVAHTVEDLKVSEKDLWIKECFKLLSELRINALLVYGEVDPAIAGYCSTHSILLLFGIPWTTLEILCISVNESPCTYMLDCDEENVISNLFIKKWNFDYNKMVQKYLYFHVDIIKVDGTKKPHTVILCHPSQPVLSSLEHQFWHVASRLHFATEENKLLPGGGRTEEFCCNSLLKIASEINPESRIKVAIANGFMNYFKIISDKKKTVQELDDECLDEMKSKIQAWRSAMSLALVVLQCDCLILNECGDNIVKEFDFKQNLIGFL